MTSNDEESRRKIEIKELQQQKGLAVLDRNIVKMNSSLGAIDEGWVNGTGKNRIDYTELRQVAEAMHYIEKVSDMAGTIQNSFNKDIVSSLIELKKHWVVVKESVKQQMING